MPECNYFCNKKIIFLIIFLIIIVILAAGFVSLHISWYKTWANNEHYYSTMEHQVTLCEMVLFSNPSNCKQHLITDWCNANGGVWNTDTRECSGISESACSDVRSTDYYDSKCHMPINQYTEEQLIELCSDSQDVDRGPCYFYRFVEHPVIQSVPLNGTLSGIVSRLAQDRSYDPSVDNNTAM